MLGPPSPHANGRLTQTMQKRNKRTHHVRPHPEFREASFSLHDTASLPRVFTGGYRYAAGCKKGRHVSTTGWEVQVLAPGRTGFNHSSRGVLSYKVQTSSPGMNRSAGSGGVACHSRRITRRTNSASEKRRPSVSTASSYYGVSPRDVPTTFWIISSHLRFPSPRCTRLNRWCEGSPGLDRLAPPCVCPSRFPGCQPIRIEASGTACPSPPQSTCGNRPARDCCGFL